DDASVEKVTYKSPVTRCWIVIRALGSRRVPPSRGSIDSWEMPTILSTRLVSSFLTLGAIIDSFSSEPGGAVCACAPVVVPKISKLMMSEGGNAGSDVYVVRI